MIDDYHSLIEDGMEYDSGYIHYNSYQVDTSDHIAYYNYKLSPFYSYINKECSLIGVCFDYKDFKTK